jgi:hypothetical protein
LERADESVVRCCE